MPAQAGRIPIKETPRPVVPVSPASPAAPVDAAESGDDDDAYLPDVDGVVRIGPTERLNGVPRQFGPEPPQGEREGLIWADGAVRVGAGQGGPAAACDAEAAGVCAEEAQH